VVIASITSCTNTSNPYVMIGAGLVARKARALGLTRKPWVKTSLAPGSQVVSAYLEAANLQEDLDAIGFNLVGYGCTTCIGNSGPLQPEISKAINENDLIATSVLSGNRNFEGRISPDVRANYLASPPLVVAYALAGDMNIDIANEPIAQTRTARMSTSRTSGRPRRKIAELVERPSRARRSSRNTPTSSRATRSGRASRFRQPRPTTGRRPRPTSRTRPTSRAWAGARHDLQHRGRAVLALLGDMITTDHISPGGSFKETTPAGQYLTERQVPQREFNSYGSRRGNHEVMMRGTFANIRIKNEMLDGVEGGYTKGPTGSRPRSTTPRWPTRRRARRWSSSAASSTARAPRATGRRRARRFWASRP
jgi:aconitate hydratase